MKFIDLYHYPIIASVIPNGGLFEIGCVICSANNLEFYPIVLKREIDDISSTGLGNTIQKHFINHHGENSLESFRKENNLIYGNFTSSEELDEGLREIPIYSLAEIIDQPLNIRYNNMINEIIRRNGITLDYEEIKRMVPKLNDYNAENILLEVFEDIDYPISLEEGALVLLLPTLGIQDIANIHLRFDEVMNTQPNLDEIIMDNDIDPVHLIYLLLLWFTQKYNRPVNVYFGTDPKYIDSLNDSLSEWKMYHRMRPLFPVLFSEPIE